MALVWLIAQGPAQDRTACHSASRVPDPLLPCSRADHIVRAESPWCVSPQVQYTVLSHYEERYDDFKSECDHLRRRFTHEGERRIAPYALPRKNCL